MKNEIFQLKSGLEVEVKYERSMIRDMNRLGEIQALHLIIVPTQESCVPDSELVEVFEKLPMLLDNAGSELRKQKITELENKLLNINSELDELKKEELIMELAEVED